MRKLIVVGLLVALLCIFISWQYFVYSSYRSSANNGKVPLPSGACPVGMKLDIVEAVPKIQDEATDGSTIIFPLIGNPRICRVWLHQLFELMNIPPQSVL